MRMIKFSRNRIVTILSLAILASLFAACNSDQDPRNAHTLVYAIDDLGSVPDNGCIVIRTYPSNNCIWVALPPSHAEVDRTLRMDRDYYLKLSTQDHMKNSTNDNPHLFFRQDKDQDFIIYENCLSMRIELREDFCSLLFKVPASRVKINNKLVGKVLPK